nr:hypothetical protein Iba_chr02cCG10430 [Ipomoea batatas]
MGISRAYTRRANRLWLILLSLLGSLLKSTIPMAANQRQGCIHLVGDEPEDPVEVLFEEEEWVVIPYELVLEEEPLPRFNPDLDCIIFLKEIQDMIDCGTPTRAHPGIALFWEEVGDYPPRTIHVTLPLTSTFSHERVARLPRVDKDEV